MNDWHGIPYIKVQRLSPYATVPHGAYSGDAGFDLAASERVVIDPNAFVDVPIGIAIALPEGFWARITGRSSTFRKFGLHVVEGVIDNGYRGPLFAGIWNASAEQHVVAVGDRLAQLIVQRIESPEWSEVDELPPSQRGSQGFGSSGR